MLGQNEFELKVRSESTTSNLTETLLKAQKSSKTNIKWYKLNSTNKTPSLFRFALEWVLISLAIGLLYKRFIFFILDGFF